jgi:hypothetical protein
MPFVAFSLAAGGNARAFLYRAGFAGGSTAALRSQRQRLLRYGARGDRSAQARPMPLRDGRAAGAPARARSARQIEHGEEGVELRRFRHEAVGVKPVRMPRRKLIAASRLRGACSRTASRAPASAPAAEAAALRLKSRMARVGDVRTFDNFVVPVPQSIDVSGYNTAIVWCESFSMFITAAKYR